MAADPWNRVNVPFPGAVSSVQVHFSRTTAAHVKQLCSESCTLLQLLRSEALQTEVRLLYDLLHVLNNSLRGNKTFRALKQVEQCINRLKDMKLDGALQDLTDLCPTRMQRGVSLQAGEGAVPSQPMLEWLCLKVLGAAELMSCTLSRCSRAFILSRQQMKWDEFIISNTVITSMLSRLWVFFRGVLVCLASLYQQLLELLREVAQAKPMPFLTDFSLPADMAQFLGPSSASLLTKKPQQQEEQQQQRNKERKRKAPAKIPNQAKRQKKEDLGVAVQRDQLFDIDVKPLFKGLGDFKEALKNKPSPQERRKAEKKQMFKKQVRAATTFTDMATHLEEMIEWCKSHSLVKEKRLLSFLYLKCQKMKGLESAGYTIQRKLRSFQREVCWASSPAGSVPRTCLPIAALWRNTHPRTRLRTLRTRFRRSTTTNCAKKKEKKRRRKTTESSVSRLSEYDKGSRTSHETSECEGRDDIDDIFASVGL
ncbi:nucleolus and neural progenitor protein [Myripristis murdjan]|uniref:Nucleolus and neural progenitor protein n=1 Tax=Myripristis murdjan TaxID=586833 RepID=A0A667ZSK9_9TELE|nr:nucleolus and neural progenitor protein [Myripristis murdjan]